MKTLSEQVEKHWAEANQTLKQDHLQNRQNNYTLPIFTAIFLAALFVGLFAFYSQQFINNEYGQASSNPEQFDSRCLDTRFTDKYRKEVLGLEC